MKVGMMFFMNVLYGVKSLLLNASGEPLDSIIYGVAPTKDSA